MTKTSFSPRPTWALAVGCAIGLGLGLAACGGPSQPDICKNKQPGDLAITEVMSDPAGTDTGNEWFELYNASDHSIDLKGLTIYVAGSDGAHEKTHVMASGAVEHGAYFVIGDSRADPIPDWEGYSYKDKLTALGNSDGKIGIRCGTKVIDEVTWKTASTSGHSRSLNGSLTPDSTNNDTDTNWCDATSTYDTNAYGTPGQANDLCGISGGTTCIDPATSQPRALVLPNASELVITELMPNPKLVADTAGEWFELYATKDLDLNGLTVAAGAGTSKLAAQTCLHMTQGSYAVIAKNADAAANGGISPVLATTSVSLANSSGTLAIKNGDAVIDQVTWPSSTEGVSISLDPDKLDATLNDDPANFCGATTGYSSFTDGGIADLGTPGQLNTPCTTVNPNQCNDATSGNARDIVPPAVGDLAITEVMADPTVVTDTSGEWFEVTSVAAGPVDLNGVVITTGSSSTPKNATLSSADCLTVNPGDALVFAPQADPGVNGGLTNVFLPITMSLPNSAGGTITLTSGTDTIDTVTYPAATAGKAWQLDSTFVDQNAATANDTQANFCAAKQTYNNSADGGTGDLGTPGATNDTCP